MTRRQRTVPLIAELGDVAHRAFSFLNFPLATIDNIQVRTMSSQRFETAEPQLCYIITIFSSNPAMLRGDVLPYKGSYKERVEAIVQDHLARCEPGSVSHLEIVGSVGGSVDGIVPLSLLVSTGKAAPASPLVRTAERYAIPGALLHGRHVVGPSPAVAAVVRRIVRSFRPTTVLDLFAGTGIASKVACSESTPTSVTVVDVNPATVAFQRSHLSHHSIRFCQTNAFSYSLTEAVDLLVADPYYHQTMDLLDSLGSHIREHARRFVLACGSVEDVAWTRSVRARLRALGLKVDRHARFGQVIYECVRD